MANIVNQYGQVKVGVRVASGGGGNDADAQAFITAASITDSTQQTAINTLVSQLKTYGIWSKMKAIYPFVGGTAAQHRFNLKDPRTVNAAFYLEFFGGWTHSSTGALPNGVNAYADTYLIPSIDLLTNNTHLSHYSRTQNSATNSHDMGSEKAGYTYDLYQYYNGVSAKGFLDGTYPQDASQVNNTNTLGLLIGTRIANNNQKTYFNGVLQNTNTNIKVLPLPNNSIYIGATHNDLIASSPSNKQCAFSSIGDGLTDTEAANFYTAVQTYQTTLGRAV